jgi:hypothetical protein
VLRALLARVRVGVEEVQVADDDADFLEDEGLKHETTHQSLAGQGAASPLSTIARPMTRRLALAGVTYFSHCGLP